MNEKRLHAFAGLLQKGILKAKEQLEENLGIKAQILGVRDFELSGKMGKLLLITEQDIKLLERVIRWLNSREKQLSVNQLRELLKKDMDNLLKTELKDILDVSASVESNVHSLLRNLEKQYDLLERNKSGLSNPPRFLKEYKGLIEEQRRLYEKIIRGSSASEIIFTKITTILRRWRANPEFVVHILLTTMVIAAICLQPFMWKMGNENVKAWQQEKQRVLSVFEESRRIETGTIMEVHVQGKSDRLMPVYVPFAMHVSSGGYAEVILNTQHGPIQIKFYFGAGNTTGFLLSSDKVLDKLNLVQKGQQVQILTANYSDYVIGFDINVVK